MSAPPPSDPRHTALGAILVGAVIGSIGAAIRYGLGLSLLAFGGVMVLAGLAWMIGGRRS